MTIPCPSLGLEHLQAEGGVLVKRVVAGGDVVLRVRLQQDSVQQVVAEDFAVTVCLNLKVRTQQLRW